MTTSYRLARNSNQGKYRAARSLRYFISLALLPLLVAAQQQRNTVEVPPVEEQEASDTALAPPPETHATQQAPQELLNMAVHQPEKFIGKILILHDGVHAVTVGRVIGLRRRVQDQDIYLIVDARPYFNAAVEYAVALNDVDRMDEDRLVIPEAPGMHLKGLDYYPDDYVDIKNMPLEKTGADFGD
jgi:hypothetical protein